MRQLLALAVVITTAAVALVPTSHAQNGGDPTAQERAAAIDKGIGYLKKAQQADGSWDYEDGPFNIGVHMKQGCTALCALALLKSGTPPDDAPIKKAFDFMASCPIEHTYSAGCVLLALEARYNWEPPREDESEAAPGETTREKPAGNKPAAKKQHPSGRDVDLAQRCMEFLVKVQAPTGTWSYPTLGQMRAGLGRDGDLSNAQYALLGLDAAERLGLTVPKEPYEKAQEYLQGLQEKEGPEVPGFAVPGADMSYKDLRKVEKEMRDKLKQIDKEFAGKGANDVNAAGHTESDERRATTEDAAKKILQTTSRAKMHARGFTYTGTPPPKEDGSGDGNDPNGGNPGGGRGRGGPGGGGRGGRMRHGITGSMTTAGIGCLFICKAHLDGTRNYEKTYKASIDRAIRDGAAWIAKDFSVHGNPGQNEGRGGGGFGGGGGGGGGGGFGGGGRARAGHLFYYLYGLERSGVLLLVPKFGDHDWYAEGCKALVHSQSANGSWDAGEGEGTVGAVCDTCFSLLFLARGTTPLVRIPTRTATGPGSDGMKPQPAPSNSPAPAPSDAPAPTASGAPAPAESPAPGGSPTPTDGAGKK